MASFSLLSAASCINAQPLCWVNPSELKWRANDTATGVGQWPLFHWPLYFSAAFTPDPVPNLLSQQLHPFLSLPCLAWLGWTLQCSKKSPAWPWSPAPPKWFYFLCGYRENSPLQGLSCTPAVLQGPVSMELSWEMLLGAVWGSSEPWDEPGVPEGHSPSAAPSASPALLPCRIWELSLLLVPSFLCACI